MPLMSSRAYRNYLLGLLAVIGLFNFVDRLALGLLIQDIKVDLNLSDTQIGLLGGIAFALFYSVMGVPIARWADRGDRVVIISATAALWSAAVTLCGVAGSFIQLMAIRVAVAIGEAGCVPPAFSLISDYFSRAERPRASAIYGLGGPLSGIVGFLVAGWLNELYGWRITFMLLGVPGFILAVIAWFTLIEPRRRAQTAAGVRPQRVEQVAPVPSLTEVALTLWRYPTFRHLVLCLSTIYFFGYGISLWQPSFFIRYFGLSTGEVGTWMAAIYGMGGLVATYCGGEFCSRYARSNERLQLRAVAIAIASAGVLSILIYTSPNKYLAFAFMIPAVMGPYTANGPVAATIQTLVPERMRAVAFAVVFLIANLIGMGLGPLAAGALSDGLRALVGEESLRYSLLILAPGYFVGAWLAWRAGSTVTDDLADVEAEQHSLPDYGHDAARAKATPPSLAMGDTR